MAFCVQLILFADYSYAFVSEKLLLLVTAASDHEELLTLTVITQ